jgi:hypothetical protein
VRATNTKALAKRVLIVAALAPLAFQAARGQGTRSTSTAAAKSGAAAATEDATRSGVSDVAKTLKVAAEAVGLARWSAVGGQHLPEVDVINTMEVWASGTCYDLGQSNKPGEPGQAFKAEFHVALGYNPPALRLEMTRDSSGGRAQHTIQVVRDNYAWDESEIGAGLIPGRGTATPAMAAVNNRLLRLWLLPYGVIKAAVAAGDKTKLSTEKGATILTFPLGGPLADVTVKATLDGQNEVAKVETSSENPALSGLLTEIEYSDYKDHGEIATDVKSPGHIAWKQGGHPVFDIQVKTWDANNPYLVFPVPENVKQAAAQ